MKILTLGMAALVCIGWSSNGSAQERSKSSQSMGASQLQMKPRVKLSITDCANTAHGADGVIITVQNTGNSNSGPFEIYIRTYATPSIYVARFPVSDLSAGRSQTVKADLTRPGGYSVGLNPPSKFLDQPSEQALKSRPCLR